MNTKTKALFAIVGIFAITAFLFTQTLADFQISFAAKGGEPGCGDNQKAIAASDSSCVKGGNCDDDDGGVTSGGCSDDEGSNDDNHGCPQNPDGICHGAH